MSLEGLFAHTIDIYRAQQGTGIKTSYVEYNSGVSCLIQPVSAEFASKTDFVYGRSYNCLLSLGTDIAISDRVIDQDGKTYQVNATLNRNYGINVSHLTVILIEQASEGINN